MGQLKANGKEVVHEDKGDIVVINTCGFIDNAKEESINTILEYVDLKNQGAVEKVFVTGCLSERYKPDLIRDSGCGSVFRNPRSANFAKTFRSRLPS
jgi:ribosomal protein S12 methylthiotransferase